MVGLTTITFQTFFCFLLTEKSEPCYVNAPGSVHDSTMAKWGGLYQKIDNMYRISIAHMDNSSNDCRSGTNGSARGMSGNGRSF
jgi:hypothetical protein